MNRSFTPAGSSPWRWLPNALSAFRGIAAIPIFLLAVAGEWRIGFWLVIIALVTDFLDGLAAKKLHAESMVGSHIDRISDFLLAGFGTLGLIVGADLVSPWVLAFCVPAAFAVGYVKFCTPAGTHVYNVTSAVSVVLLFIVWIGVAWGYLAQAYGWSWSYAGVTIAILLVAAACKKHRLQSWFGWMLSR